MINIRIKSGRFTAETRAFVAFVSMAAVVLNFCAIGALAQQPKTTPVARLSEDQRILHVLNRLAFGARPGDVERVRAIGLENYINQQLSPEKINDAASEARLKDLPVLNMTTAELYEKYPQPGQLLRQLERRGDVPAGLTSVRGERGRSQTPAAGQDTATMKGKVGDAGMDQAVSTPGPEGNPRDNTEYRQALRQYYQQHGLQLPQRIIAELQSSRILRAVYSERQLQEVMVDFWTNHFNVFAGKGADRWLLISYDRDTIRPNAMGKFSELLTATAQSPAMLFYLDNFQSVSPDAQAGQRMRRGPGRRALDRPGAPELPANLQGRRRGINENYARELMELHTIGVDGGYTQKDVQEVARCFTGWTILAPRGGAAATQAMRNEARAERLRENAGKFFFNPRVHDDGEKVVLGHKIPAGGGFKDGLAVLDILARHPATAKFVATKLARYFVSDEPPAALVSRVSTAFTKSNGDIRETLRAIFSSPEFNSPEAYRGKVKRPFELAISALRTLGAETNGGPQLHQWIARMGEPLYGFQTPNGYSDTAESWVNTGGLLERMNFGLSLASNRIPGTRVDLKRFVDGPSAAKPFDNTQITDRFLSLIVAGEISPKTKATLLKQINENAAIVVPARPVKAPATAGMQEEMAMDNEPPFRQRRQQMARTDANITDPLTKIVGLILGSPEFQRQ